jgi:hypothetical protein
MTTGKHLPWREEVIENASWRWTQVGENRPSMRDLVTFRRKGHTSSQ